VTPSDSWRFPDLLGVTQDHGDGSQLTQRDAIKLDQHAN